MCRGHDCDTPGRCLTQKAEADSNTDTDRVCSDVTVIGVQEVIRCKAEAEYA